jgi:lipopolysaccharide/colanic/teichoic acid biosynthesis glycosyltransferase
MRYDSFFPLRWKEIPIEAIPGYHMRHSVRPGLTWVAQVFTQRDVLRRHKFRYDPVYVMSLLLDVRLIFLSLWISLRGKKY